jgi:hypothetical protein
MSNLQRREFLAAAGFVAAAAALTRPKSAEAGDPSFMNNVPDPILAGDELPTFKFELEKSEGKVIGHSSGKEATGKQLPISKGIAGVSMRLEPGAMREPHWHATEAEWAFVIEGRVRTTVITPEGAAETNDFDPGDVWYFPPRLRPHAGLECLGDRPTLRCTILATGGESYRLRDARRRRRSPGAEVAAAPAGSRQKDPRPEAVVLTYPRRGTGVEAVSRDTALADVTRRGVADRRGLARTRGATHAVDLVAGPALRSPPRPRGRPWPDRPLEVRR